jgi:hypothetical protein
MWDKLVNTLLTNYNIKIPIEKRFFIAFLDDDSEHINKN